MSSARILVLVISFSVLTAGQAPAVIRFGCGLYTVAGKLYTDENNASTGHLILFEDTFSEVTLPVRIIGEAVRGVAASKKRPITAQFEMHVKEPGFGPHDSEISKIAPLDDPRAINDMGSVRMLKTEKCAGGKDKKDQ